MPQGLLRAVGDLPRSHVEEGGMERIPNGPLLLRPYGPDAPHHARKGAHRSAVTVSVKSGLHRHAHGSSEVALTIKQRGCLDHGVGDGMAPAVGGVFILYHMSKRRFPPHT